MELTYATALKSLSWGLRKLLRKTWDVALGSAVEGVIGEKQAEFCLCKLSLPKYLQFPFPIVIFQLSQK